MKGREGKGNEVKASEVMVLSEMCILSATEIIYKTKQWNTILLTP